MRAMILEKVKQQLIFKNIPVPSPKPLEILIKVSSCGVCRTDVHIVDGELERPKLPLILGHQVVGIIEELGKNATKYQIGDRIGIPWLAESCQKCEYCLSERENLCDAAIFTGYTRNGGYAEYCTANEDFVFPLPYDYDDIHLSPLLCAGFIGFRAFRLAGLTKTIGLYGFGSSAHLLIQIASSLDREVYVFTRPGDLETQKFAKSLGAKWAGGSDELPPKLLDAAILFAPVGWLYPQALRAVKKGGKVVSAGIHMSDIPSFPYSFLWEERSMSSVANLTRQDGIDFLKQIEKVDLKISVTSFQLEEANQALDAIRNGKIEGSVVLKISR